MTMLGQRSPYDDVMITLIHHMTTCGIVEEYFVFLGEEIDGVLKQPIPFGRASRHSAEFFHGAYIHG